MSSRVRKSMWISQGMPQFLLCAAVGMLFVNFTVKAQSGESTEAQTNIEADSRFKSVAASVQGPAAYAADGIQIQAARFVLEAPAQLRSISIALSGPPHKAAARVRVFGHEAGLPMPQQQVDLIEAVIFEKSTYGMQSITYRLERPLELNNNQFFIAVDQLAEGVKLLTDRSPASADCRSKNGDLYGSQLILHEDTWKAAPYRFGIEVELEQETYESTVFALDSNAFKGRELLRTHSMREAQSDKSNVCVADVNGDAFLDVLVNNKLYTNAAGREFELRDFGGVEDAQLTFFLDFDNDARQDIAQYRDGVLQMYKQDALGSFVPHSSLALDLKLARCFSLADVNKDGYDDILLAGTSGEASAAGAVLLENNGDGGFAVALELGSLQNVLSVELVDYDSDGNPDIFLSGAAHQDELWHNRGSMQFQEIYSQVFQETALADGQSSDERQSTSSAPGRAGAVEQGRDYTSRAVFWTDINNDGRPDMLAPGSTPVNKTAFSAGAMLASRVWTGAEESGGILLRQQGRHNFIHPEQEHSGGVWADLDNNGLLDCILVPAASCRFLDVYLQEAPDRFRLATAELGLDGLGGLRDLVLFDVNNDGALDLLAVSDDLTLLFRNAANSHSALMLDLTAADGRSGNATTHVKVFAGRHVYTRFVNSGRGMAVQDPPRLHIGLGGRPADSVHVHWDGARAAEVFRPTKGDGLLDIYEGGGVRPADGQVQDLNVVSFPNPFSGSVSFDIDVRRAGPLRLEIYSIHGDLVRVLLDTEAAAGRLIQRWAGDDANGIRLPAGVYVFKARSGAAEFAGRLTLID